MEYIIIFILAIVGLAVFVWAFGELSKLLVNLFALIYCIPRTVFCYVRFRRLKSKAYDIEKTSNIFKIIRNKRGKYGMCYWNDYGDCKLLLTPRFSLFGKYPNNIYIVQKGKKMGIYNAELRKFIAKCKYESISVISDEVYALRKNEEEKKINYLGDRVVN